MDAAGVIQHLTIHQADSLPRTAIERMRAELKMLPQEQRRPERRKRIQDLLDRGLGSCLLRRAQCAQIVEDSLLYGDGTRYRLLAWVIMPNHMHVLIEQLPIDSGRWSLGKIVQSWKRHTTREIRRALSDPGSPTPGAPSPGAPSCTRQSPSNAEPIWQRDYWDRFIRNEHHFQAAKSYIERNPVVAGLVEAPEAWPWGSARFEADRR